MGIELLEKEFNRPLYCWGDIIVNPDIQENLDDIWLAIRYDDHGDDFWLIGTKNGSFYRYGYIINRTCEHLPDNMWIRKPNLFKKVDERAHVSNHLFFYFREHFEEKTDGIFSTYTDTPRVYYSPASAQREFDFFMIELKTIIEGDKMVHEHRGGYGFNKSSLRLFLEANKINTEENLKKLEDQPFDTRIDGVDGSSGKVKWWDAPCEILYCDNIQFIYINGKTQDIDKAPIYQSGYDDEWGYKSVCLNLNSYRPKHSQQKQMQ